MSTSLLTNITSPSEFEKDYQKCAAYLCEPGCEGRCRKCPADLVCELLEAYTLVYKIATKEVLPEQS